MTALRQTLPLLLAALALGATATAQEIPGTPAPAPAPPAAPAAGPTGAAPWLLHVPPLVATAREPLVVRADVRAPDQVEALVLHYRMSRRGPWHEVPFRRSATGERGAWSATVPAPALNARVIEYHVTLRPRGGAARDAFATRADPHVVVVHRTDADEAERRRLADAGGRRSTAEVRGEWVDFGTQGTNNATCPVAPCEDRYYRLEASYRYRFFRAIHAIRFGMGTMRGTAPTFGVGSEPNGLDYGFADVEFRIAEQWTVMGRAILGANEERVRPGFGLALEVAPTRVTRLTFSYEGVLAVGSIVSAWMRWDTVPRTPMGVGVEVTDFPGDEVWGVRLLGEIGRRFGGLTLGVRGGYQARSVEAGGVALGGRVAYDF